MRRFEVGSRVKLINTEAVYVPLGSIGTVIEVNYHSQYNVQFEEESQYVDDHQLAPYEDKLTTTEHSELLFQLIKIMKL